MRSFRVWIGSGKVKADAALGRAASAVLILMVLASITDYPLRVPSLACFAVLAAVWLSQAAGPRPTKTVEVSTGIG